MIDSGHPRLSVVRQCELVSISRSSFYREPAPDSAENLVLMRLIDEQFLETPWYGSRQMARHLRRNGWCVGRHRVRRLMIRMGLAPIYQRPKTSEPHPHHKIYPYLLRHLTIDRPDQVWCADITYIQMRRGFLYLVAIMDWASRKVLAWRCRTRWIRSSALLRWKRQSLGTADPKSSTPTRARSSPASPLPTR